MLPKKRDRRGYTNPKRAAERAAREAAKLATYRDEMRLSDGSVATNSTDSSLKTSLATLIPDSTGDKKSVTFLPQGKKLSAVEAQTLTHPFIGSIEDYCKYMDQYLWARQSKAGKSNGERPIWSNLDEEELEAFTRVMMRAGQKNEFAAAAVRGVVEARDYFTAALIFGPRVAVTREIIMETQVPKPPRVRREKQS